MEPECGNNNNINKLGLRLAKLSSSGPWTLLYFSLDLVCIKICIFSIELALNWPTGTELGKISFPSIGYTGSNPTHFYIVLDKSHIGSFMHATFQAN